ncbi:MAG: hypothetical protein HGB17_06130 [Syntrophobacteraceae bacterium]|nr:hypothetical protein [Syntrophobacteraceae bacterium]
MYIAIDTYKLPAGNFDATLTITHNDKTQNAIAVPIRLVVQNSANAAVSWESTSGYPISVDFNKKFPDVYPNRDYKMALTLTNTGVAQLTVNEITVDDNGLYRQKRIAAMRDLEAEEVSEVSAREADLSYVKLEGTIGCIVNGAGLAMATMDIIKLSGGEPANFLDVGGGASAETVEQGFRIILSDKNVKAILVNIFGGIVRCDRVANGVIQASKNLNLSIPVVVRLQGTNAEEAKEIIDNSGLKV